MSYIAKWKTFPKEKLKQFVQESSSYKEITRKVGYGSNSGSGISQIKEMIEYYHFDDSHILDKRKRTVPDEIRFVYGTKYKTTKFKKRLIELRGQKCENCGIEEWLGMPINLEVHHIDGDRRNNTLENLILLCPNCHSYTDNYKGRNINNNTRKISDEDFIQALKDNNNIHQAILQLNLSPCSSNYNRAYKLIEENDITHLKEIKTKNQNKCKRCGKEISKSAKNYCPECQHFLQRKTERPEREELKVLIRNKSFTQIGKDYNVSDNAIRKWCDFYGLPRKKSEINSYSDEEWEKI